MRRRWLDHTAYWVAVALAAAGLTHLGSVLALPFESRSDAYAQLLAAAGGIRLKAIQGTSAMGRLPYQDPAMAGAFCLFDLRQGPITASLGVAATDFAVLSVHSRHGRVLYGLTNRSASQNRLAVTLLSSDQAAHHPAEADPAAVPEIHVETDEPEGFVMAQSLAPSPSEGAAAEAEVAGLSCSPATP